MLQSEWIMNKQETKANPTRKKKKKEKKRKEKKGKEKKILQVVHRHRNSRPQSLPGLDYGGCYATMRILTQAQVDW